MRNRILLLMTIIITIIITGCLSEKKKEDVQIPVISQNDSVKEFAIGLGNVDYTSVDSGVTVDVSIRIPATEITTAGTIYYVVSTTFPAIAPTAAEIRTGRDARWNLYFKSGSITTSGITATAISIAGLEGTHEYDIFLGASDINGNIIRKVTKLHIIADTVPPEIATASSIAMTETTATIGITQTALNLKGKIYYVLTTPGAVSPDSSQIKAGLNGVSTTAGVIKAAYVTIKTTAQAFTITGLTRFNSYKLYIAEEDANRNLQIVPTQIDIRTIDVTMPIFTSTSINVTSTSAVIRARLGEAGTIYYAVFPNGTLTTGITSGAVKAGTGTTTFGAVTTAGLVLETITVTGISFDKQYEVFITAEDVSANIQKIVTKLHVGSDFEPPAIADTSLAAITMTERSVKISAGLGEKGKIYYVVTTTGALTPSSVVIRDGTGYSLKGTITLTGTANVEYTITGLTSLNDYKLYAVGEDALGNLQTTVSSINISTIDTTAPLNTLGYPTKASVTTNSAVIQVSINESGTVYYEVVSKSAIRTPVQVVVATTATSICGNVTVAAVSAKNITISGLSINSDYDIVIAAKDTSGNIQSTVSRILINTAATIATIDTPATIKGVTISSIGTPSASLASVVPGTVTLTSTQAISTGALTLFTKTDSQSVIKVVKYSSGASTSNFSTATGYNDEIISDSDFFIIKVTAQDTTTVKYYKIVVTVAFSTQLGTYLGKTTTGTGSALLFYDTNIAVTEPTTRYFDADAYFRIAGIISYTGDKQYSYVTVTKDSDPTLETIYWLKGIYDKKIWLRYGSGAYTIKVYLTTITNGNTISTPYDGDILGWSYSGQVRYTFNVNNTRNEDGKFLYPSEFIQSDDPSIVSAATVALSASPTAVSIQQKARVLHDYVVKQISYDLSSLDVGKRKKQDAVTTLANKTAVCEGYTSLYDALLRSQGIKAKAIAGTAGGAHAWSNVYDGSLWKFVDTTWDDPLINGTSNYPTGSNLRTTYFWLSSLTGVGGDHTVQDERPERAIAQYEDLSKYLFGKAVEGMY